MYHSRSGRLRSKAYAGEALTDTEYTYSLAGRPVTRVWQRNVTTSYATTPAGEVDVVTYSVGGTNETQTAPLRFGYDRLGRRNTIKTYLPGTLATSILSATPPAPMSTLSQSYNDLGEPETEFWSGGPLAGRSVTTPRDSFGRRQGVTASVAGERLEDGLWTYTWDAENRLISMQSQALVPASGRRKLDVEYDPLGRRIGRIVSTGAGGSWVPISTTRWLYEGWNPVAELNSAGTLVREYVWGTDLSGNWQGAGGVGGSLWVLEAPTGTSINAHYAAYDGNGNVMGLVNAADGTWSARYEYGPFGEVIRATGPMASANPFRWSTKIQDEDSGLNYYGYRYYSAGMGRWLNRDPIQEFGADSPPAGDGDGIHRGQGGNQVTPLRFLKLPGTSLRAS